MQNRLGGMPEIPDFGESKESSSIPVSVPVKYVSNVVKQIQQKACAVFIPANSAETNRYALPQKGSKEFTQNEIELFLGGPFDIIELAGRMILAVKRNIVGLMPNARATNALAEVLMPGDFVAGDAIMMDSVMYQHPIME